MFARWLLGKGIEQLINEQTLSRRPLKKQKILKFVFHLYCAINKSVLIYFRELKGWKQTINSLKISSWSDFDHEKPYMFTEINLRCIFGVVAVLLLLDIIMDRDKLSLFVSFSLICWRACQALCLESQT